MNPPSMLARLKQSAVVQAVLLFVGASWVVLQVVDMLTERLGLPDWVFPVALILLAVGFVVVLATAWVQSKAETTAAEEAGEIPTDWEVAPADAIASLKAGRLPHLTWGRAIVGGVVSLSLLIGVAGAYVLLTGGRGPFGPTEAGADEAAVGIAILPFSVNNPELAQWEEGIVDLLQPGLDGLAGFSTVSSRTVLARWQEAIGDALADQDAALRVAGSTGARYGVLGRVVALGSDVRLTAEAFDLADRSKVAEGSAEGPAENVLALVDELGIDLLRDLVAEVGDPADARQLPSRLTTTSLEGARAFLEGEEHYRAGRFAEAIASYTAAAEADSTFGLAVLRANQALGYHGSAEQQDSADRRLERALPYLSPRDRSFAQIMIQVGGDSLQSIAPATRAVVDYPDDPEAWFLLGEVRHHESGLAGGGNKPAREAFEKALELAPGFVPYLFHGIDYSIGAGDDARADELLGLLRAAVPDDPRIRGYEIMASLARAELDEARAVLRENLQGALPDLVQIRIEPDLIPRYMELFTSIPAGGEIPMMDVQSSIFMAAGRRAEALALLDRIPVGNGLRMSLARHHQDLGIEIPGFDSEAEYRVENCAGASTVTCREKVAVHAVDAGRLDEARAIIAWADSVAEQDTIPGRRLIRQRLGRVVEGYMHWKSGDLDAALRAFAEGRKLDNFAASSRWYHGHVLAEAGYPTEAVSVFLSLDDNPTWMPFGRVRAAEVLESMGDAERAAELYRSALNAWVDADPDFAWKPRAEEGLTRVGG